MPALLLLNIIKNSIGKLFILFCYRVAYWDIANNKIYYHYNMIMRFRAIKCIFFWLSIGLLSFMVYFQIAKRN